MHKKTFLRILILASIVMWMLTVFQLSNQNSTESSGLSRKVAGIIVSEEKIDIVEPYVRKIAHLTEYMIRWNVICCDVFNI